MVSECRRFVWTWRGFRIYRRDILNYSDKYGTLIEHKNKHGTCNEIPKRHRDKPILATVRNPYEWYVSQYEFGWWKSEEAAKYFHSKPDFRSKYPNFPEITFDKYVELINLTFSKSLKMNSDGGGLLGLATNEFIRYYFRRPRSVVRKITDDYISSRKYMEDMYTLHFIRTDRLNEQLYAFLLKMGYKCEDVEFVLRLGKILPDGKGRREDQVWEKYYTPELKQRVRQKERLIFMLFPEFDV